MIFKRTHGNFQLIKRKESMERYNRIFPERSGRYKNDYSSNVTGMPLWMMEQHADRSTIFSHAIRLDFIPKTLYIRSY